MWQNAGRSGIDQWNFRVSPVNGSQDPTGDYCRKWLPELARLPAKHIHAPWNAPAAVLASAGVVLGKTYPERIEADLKAARARTVAAMLEMRRNAQQWNDAGGYDLIRCVPELKTTLRSRRSAAVDCWCWELSVGYVVDPRPRRAIIRNRER